MLLNEQSSALASLLLIALMVVLFGLRNWSPPLSSDPSSSYADNVHSHTVQSQRVLVTRVSKGSATSCNDPLWCNIPIPKTSFFKFDPIIDEKRWEAAKIEAASGRQSLLEQIIPYFPTWTDFLDGDTSFRSTHKLADVFIDDRNWFRPLTTEADKHEAKKDYNFRVPPPYDFRAANRAPIVQIGFFAFAKTGPATYLEGSMKPKQNVFIEKKMFFRQWALARSKINTTFIAMMTLNENWGWLSTHYPNRTKDWGACCSKEIDLVVRAFLDDEHTLALVVNQHTNLSHPKVISAPRGIPLHWEHTGRLVWDSMHSAANTMRKEKLLMAASSTWGPRPQILKCVSARFNADDFEGHLDTIGRKDLVQQKSDLRSNRRLYYERLSAARFGLCLPGLGYDTFRTWEYLTMGTIPVLEKGVGFERTMWRLPVLFVEDFAELSPALLRAAYVEAVYRKHEFEYARLRQSYWWGVLTNVSTSRSTKPLTDAFPMEAEDAGFTRPRFLFDCWKTDSCGPGTKRVPANSC